MFGKCLENGKTLCDKWGVEFERRPRRKKRMAGENVQDSGLSATDEMKRVTKGSSRPSSQRNE